MLLCFWLGGEEYLFISIHEMKSSPLCLYPKSEQTFLFVSVDGHTKISKNKGQLSSNDVNEMMCEMACVCS